MKITDVRIKVLEKKDSNFKGFANVVFDECFVVNGIRILDGKNGLFLSMPSQKDTKGDYYDICFPTTKEFRQELTDVVLDAYEDELEKPVEDKKTKRNRR